MANKKIMAALLILILAILGMVASTYLVKQRQEIRKRAAPATTIYFGPPTVTANVGQTINFDILVDTEENALATVRLDIDYDPSVLEALSLSFNANLLPQPLRPIDLSQSGKISGSAGVAIGSSVSGAGQKVASVSFRTLSAAPSGTTIDFGPNTTAYSASPSEPIDTNLINIKVSAEIQVTSVGPTATPTSTPPPGATSTPTPTGTEIPTPTLTFTPTPSITPVPNPVSWKTNYVSLEADNFYLIADGVRFEAPAENITSIHSDPGSSTYTTLEVIWQEHGREMRLFMYFNADGTNWWSPEIRTYHAQDAYPDWIYYYGRFFESQLGISFTDNIHLNSDPGQEFTGNLHFENLHLQAFLNFPTPSPTRTPTPTGTVAPERIVGDFNDDGEVDLLDFEIFRELYVAHL